VAGPVPQVATSNLFKQDQQGASAGPFCVAGPLLHIPDKSTTVSIDPLRLAP